MVLIAEDRNRQIDGRRQSILARLGLGVFDGPARVAILLAELRGLVFPVVGDAPVLDRLLLVLGVALTRSGDQARIDDLARHGDVTGLPKRCIEALEQWPNGAGLREFLPEQPNRTSFERAPTATATLDWKTPLDARGHILLFEAFVSHQPESNDDPHIRDARLAVGKFREGMRDPLAFRSAINEPSCLNLVGAALLGTGWATDIDILSQPCLVVRQKGGAARPEPGRSQ